MVAGAVSVGEEPAGAQSATCVADGRARISGNILARRHAVVTGAGRGIGAAIAHALVAESARVTLIGRDAETLGGAAAALASAHPGSDALTISADVSDSASISQAMAQARERFGPIQILINNA